jgi:hypothetical protein
LQEDTTVVINSVRTGIPKCKVKTIESQKFFEDNGWDFDSKLYQCNSSNFLHYSYWKSVSRLFGIPPTKDEKGLGNIEFVPQYFQDSLIAPPEAQYWYHILKYVEKSFTAYDIDFDIPVRPLCSVIKEAARLKTNPIAAVVLFVDEKAGRNRIHGIFLNELFQIFQVLWISPLFLGIEVFCIRSVRVSFMDQGRRSATLCRGQRRASVTFPKRL